LITGTDRACFIEIKQVLNVADNEKKDIQSWIEKITNNDMPIFGRTVQEVISVSENDESSAAQLSQVVLKDAAMTGRVLKLANSAYYKRSDQKVSTISRAIMALGFDTVRSMCLTVALIDSLEHGRNRKHLVSEMARSLHAATQARIVAIERNDKSPEEIYISTLLYNVGDLAFWCFCDEEGEQMEIALNKPGATPDSAQREVLGFSFNELSSGLVKEWSLCDLLKTTLDNPDNKDDRTRSVVLSHELAIASEQGWDSSEVRRLTKKLAELTKSNPRKIKEKLYQGAKQAEINASDYGAKVVADLIPLPEQVVEDKQEAIESVTYQYPEVDAGLQLSILQKLTQLAADSTDLSAVMKMILEGIHYGIGMDRALFALMTPDRQAIHVKYALGDEGEILQNKFTFSLNGRNAEILKFCIDNEKAIFLNGESSSDMAEKISQELSNVIGTRTFVISPIVVKNKVIGLYYADRSLSKRELPQESFDSFQFFTQQSNLILNHLASKR